MAHTIQRLTMYAMLIALERDLRDFISLYVLPTTVSNTAFAPEMRKKAHERLIKDDPGMPQTDINLLNYLDIGDSVQIIRGAKSEIDKSTQIYISKYFSFIEKLIPIRNRVMHSRPLEFEDYSRVIDLCYDLVKSNNTLWAYLRTVQKEFERDPAFISSIIIPTTQDNNLKVLHNLPQTEFDDTGFVGREKELADLKRAINGPYPVITVSGEGGLGKTALALRACYDILDEERPRWDAIVWTTSKAARLTATEIQHIEGAISTSLGLIEHAADFLGRQSSTSAFDDMLLHLENNKILLIIDNLETIIDEAVKDFARRIPEGSKIIFTTRIGLGALDFPIPLKPLSSKESAFYFRRTANVWNLNDLATAPQDVIEDYCRKLQRSPLFIKWFVQGARGGRPVSSLSSESDLLIRFCLQNVFTYLSPEAREIARAFACLSASQTVASLVYLIGYETLVIQSSLSELLTSNLVTAERGRTSEDEDRYTLSPLAKIYVQKFESPSRDEQKKYIDKQNALRFAHEEFSARTKADVFNINFIAVRDRDDYIVAKILTRSIGLIFKEDFENAQKNIKLALDMAPNYFEVKRVEAFLRISDGRYVEAEAAYEAAISLAPHRAPIRLWYGGFISRQLGDLPRALEQFAVAEDLAPDEVYVKLEIARVLQYQRRFGEAADRLDFVSKMENLSAKQRRVLFDLQIQNETRRSEHLIAEELFDSALSAIETARELVSKTPVALIDDRVERNFQRARRQMPALGRAFLGLAQQERVDELADWLTNPLEHIKRPRQSQPPSGIAKPGSGELITSDGPNRGRLTGLRTNHGFVVNGTERLFFHRGDWRSDSDFLDLGEGSIVEYDYINRHRGPGATNVRSIGSFDLPENTSKYSKGVISELGADFGSVKLDDGTQLNFKKQDCLPGTKFKLLFLGERVRFRTTYIGGRTTAIALESHSGV